MLWGFAGAAFLVTLGITSWRNGRWSSDEPSAQPGGATTSHSINMPRGLPQHPFGTAVIPPAAPPPAQTTQSPPPPEPQPQPTVGNAPSPLQDRDSTAPDPNYEQYQDDYKQRAMLMEEIAARARSQEAGR